MGKPPRAFEQKLTRRAIQRSMMDYTIKPAGISEGRLIRAYQKNDGSLTLLVWRDDEIRNMIKAHLAKPGTHEKTFLNAMETWYLKQLEEGDAMRSAWAEECIDAMHKVQWATQWPEIDLFAV